MSAKKQADYKKIYKVKYGAKRSAIFATDDHFLISTVKGYYNEEYYRIFYSDLVALKIKISRWANAMLITLIILNLGFLAGALFIDVEVIRWISLSAFIVLLFIIAYIIIYGPHAILVFKTATAEKDFSMGRKNKILKMLKKIRPYIEKVQGSFDSAALLEETNEAEKTYKV